MRDRSPDLELADDFREALTTAMEGGDDAGEGGDHKAATVEPPAAATVEPPAADAVEPPADAEQTDAEPPADAEQKPDFRAELTDETERERLAAQLQPPEHWSSEDKAKFEALPNDATREWLLGVRTKIENSAQEKFEAAADARKLHGEVATLLKPYEQQMQREGMTATDAVKRLFAAEKMLRTNPAQGLLTLASQYGRSVAGTGQARELVQHLAHALGVGAGAFAQKGNGQAGPDDPRQAEIDNLNNRLSAFEQEGEAQRRAAVAEKVNQFQSEVTAFAEAKDEAGQPKYPHFEKARGTMATLWQASSAAGETLTLEQLYDRAVHADPELRQQVLADQQTADAAQAALQRKEAADRARRARTPTTRGSNATAADGASDLDFKTVFAAEMAQ